MKRFIISLAFISSLLACEEDEKIKDPIYEFVSFKGPEMINLNEKQQSEQAYPVVAQLLAFRPYDEDVQLTLKITGQNATQGIDFTVVPDAVLTIQKGSLISDTLWIKTIDNEAGTDLVRTIQVKIASVSKSEIKIGLGITEPKNASIVLTILDDECSLQMSIFSSTEISNVIDWGGGGTTEQVSGTVNASTVTLKGDLIGYSPFSGASLTVTLTPASSGSMKGSATFGEQETGTDSDGYEYKFVQVGDGSYDLCSGSIDVEYDIYYLDGGDWVYWYSITNIFSLP